MKLSWFYLRGCWTHGPLTIRIEHCPRLKLTYFELFDHCRFVRAFASLKEAQEHAENLQHASIRRAS